MKKIGLSVIIALAVLLVILYIRLNNNNTRNEVSDAMAAIPTDVSIIVESNNFTDLLTDLSTKTDFWNKLIEFKSFENISFNYHGVMQLIEESPELKDVLETNTVILGLRQQGNYKVGMIALVSVPTKKDRSKLKNAVRNLIAAHNIKLGKYQFNNKELVIYKLDTGKGKLYFATHKGIFLISSSRIMLETSLRQLDQGESLLDNPEFQKIASVAGQNVLANIYINYFTLGDGLVELLSNDGMRKMHKVKKVADWTVLDYKSADNITRLAGYTYVDEAPNKFLSVFTGTGFAKNEIDKYLPQSTVSYLSLNFDDYLKFHDNLVKYASAEGYYKKLQVDNKKFKQHYDFEPLYETNGIFGNNIAIATVKTNEIKEQYARYFFVKIKSESTVRDFFNQITTIYKKEHPEVKFSDKKEYIIGPTMKTYIYKLPIPHFFNFIFGRAFINVPPHNYYAFVDDYLVMSDSYDNIAYVLDAYFNDETLDKDEDYKQFKTNLTVKTNVTVFARYPFVDKLYTKYYSESLKKDFKNHLQTASAFDKFALQYSYEDGMFFTYAVVQYNPKAKVKAKVLWKTALKSEAVTKPFVFTNHYTFHKEVFVQDKDNNIYLIDREGKILWEKAIDGRIKGNIYMIDYYQNGKYQLLFNTANYIYIIDRNGQYVENYPVKLPAPASNSISVFDYEKDGNYRIFVACSNNKVYLYKKNGKQNKQWNVVETLSPVKQPVQHFVYKGKDYLVFADESHTYILNRRGETRIAVNTNFSKATNSKFYFVPKDKGHATEYFITTTKSGKLVFINLKGEVKIYKAPGDYSDNHYFAMSDINGDGKYEFIYAENNTVDIYNQELSSKMHVKLPAPVSQDLVLYKFDSKDKKIGVVTSQSQQIFLINNDGSIYSTFPKAGNTQFTIKSLIPGYGLNVLTGKGKYLVNYKL